MTGHALYLVYDKTRVAFRSISRAAPKEAFMQGLHSGQRTTVGARVQVNAVDRPEIHGVKGTILRFDESSKDASWTSTGGAVGWS